MKEVTIVIQTDEEISDGAWDRWMQAHLDDDDLRGEVLHVEQEDV